METNEYEQLQEEISRKSDDELLTMIEDESSQYRVEAIHLAKSELTTRGIEFEEPDLTADETGQEVDHSQTWRRLVNCKDVVEAGLLQSLLANNGIECELRQSWSAAALGAVPFAECYPELWVKDEADLARAQQILEEAETTEAEPAATWTCWQCGEVNEGQFGACWQCGKAREQVPAREAGQA